MRRRPEIAGREKASPAELSAGTDVFVNVRIDRRLREMLDVMFSDVCDRSKDLYIYNVMPT